MRRQRPVSNGRVRISAYEEQPNSLRRFHLTHARHWLKSILQTGRHPPSPARFTRERQNERKLPCAGAIRAVKSGHCPNTASVDNHPASETIAAILCGCVKAICPALSSGQPCWPSSCFPAAAKRPPKVYSRPPAPAGTSRKDRLSGGRAVATRNSAETSCWPATRTVAASSNLPKRQ
jgi:hypothetical protein